jgi:hypothetical protein
MFYIRGLENIAYQKKKLHKISAPFTLREMADEDGQTSVMIWQYFH